MEKRVLLLLLLSGLLINIYAQKTVDNVKNNLIGRWLSSDKRVAVTYAADMTYKLTIDSTDFLNFNYQINPTKDSLFVDFTEGVFKMKNLIFLNDKELIQANYKMGKGIDDHIDEVGIFYKEKENIDALAKVNEDPIKTHFFIPIDFKGIIMCAYKQPINTYLGDEMVINIPPSGLVKMKNDADIYKFIKRQFKFFYKNENNEAIEIAVLEPNKTYTKTELSQYKDDTICVHPLGYNQADRESINTVFGENITGNVEMYEVNWFKNLTKYLNQ